MRQLKHSTHPFLATPQMLCNFGLDVLEALSGTCTLWVVGRKRTLPLVTDALVAFMIVLLHAIVLMCQVRMDYLCAYSIARMSSHVLHGLCLCVQALPSQ